MSMILRKIKLNMFVNTVARWQLNMQTTMYDNTQFFIIWSYVIFLSILFQNHLATHIGGEFACNLCEKRFPTAAYLKYHREQKHLEELLKDPNFKGPSGKGQRTQKFDCHLCDNVFKQRVTLNVWVLWFRIYFLYFVCTKIYFFNFSHIFERFMTWSKKWGPAWNHRATSTAWNVIFVDQIWSNRRYRSTWDQSMVRKINTVPSVRIKPEWRLISIDIFRQCIKVLHRTNVKFVERVLARNSRVKCTLRHIRVIRTLKTNFESQNENF